MNVKSALKYLPAFAAVLLPSVALAAGGNPLEEASQNAVDIGVGLGAAACAGGIIGVCAGGLMRNGALLGGGAVATVAGAGWAGAPQLVQQIIGTGGGFALADLASSPAVGVFQQLIGWIA